MAHTVPFGHGGFQQKVVKATLEDAKVPIGERSSGVDGEFETLRADGVMKLFDTGGVTGIPRHMLGGDDSDGLPPLVPASDTGGRDTPLTEEDNGDRSEVVGVLAKIESVARSACDVEVVKALAGNTAGLRAYFEKAENVALNSLSVMAAAVGACPELEGVRAGTTTVRVDARGLNPGYEKPIAETYPEGYCYLDWTHDYTLRTVMAELGRWPTLGALVRQRLDWFDLRAISCSSLYSTHNGRRLHVTAEGGGRVSSLAYLVHWVRSCGNGGAGWPSGSLGEYLLTVDTVRPMSGAGVVSVAAVIGGDDAGVPANVRNAVLDDVIERCDLPLVVDRSRLWEALQLAGNGVAAVDGRPLMSGNKVLAMLGDAVLKSALIEHGTHFRVGDIQAAVSDLLSNGCLADAAKMWMVGPLLQGSLGGAKPSDYVLATAVEAIAAACYYGGGMSSVHSYLYHLTAITGRLGRYPWVRDPGGAGA